MELIMDFILAMSFWFFCVYLFYKLSPSSSTNELNNIDLTKIEQQIKISLKETQTEIKNNKEAILKFSNLINNLSQKIVLLKIEENLHQDDLAELGKMFKVLSEAKENDSSGQVFISSDFQAGRLYAIVLLSNELIKLYNDKKIILQAMIYKSEDIINLISKNNSNQKIYNAIKKLANYETKINSLNQEIKFKVNCIYHLNNA